MKIFSKKRNVVYSTEKSIGDTGLVVSGRVLNEATFLFGRKIKEKYKYELAAPKVTKQDPCALRFMQAFELVERECAQKAEVLNGK